MTDEDVADRSVVGRVRSVAVVGLRPVPVTVEAHVSNGLPGFSVIGSSGTAAGQATHRVRTALGALGLTLASRKVLLSLAPADVPKAGARFDLPMAVAVAQALGLLQETPDTVLLGELALDGRVRGVNGVLPAIAGLRAQAASRVIVAEDNGQEAALVDGLDVVAVADLAEAIGVLRGDRAGRPVAREPGDGVAIGADVDLREVRGQAEARRALEIAAAGGHHLLLIGPPGCGKSMLARRLPTILPPLSDADALELAAVRSVAGVLPPGQVLDHRPPFAAPHHSLSVAGLLGGGSGVARPGAVSLAHCGALFLDELFEWPRSVLEALREPLEDGFVRVARSQATVSYPARLQLVCAANPCPCGGGERCTCTDEAVLRYRSKLSGPLADRIDLAPAVEPLRADDLLAAGGGESSAVVAARVVAAREHAAQRWGAGCSNARIDGERLRAVASADALRLLAGAVERGELTGRGYDRTLRVARTIADLAGAETVDRDHVAEAHAHRLQLLGAGHPPDMYAGVVRRGGA